MNNKYVKFLLLALTTRALDKFLKQDNKKNKNSLNLPSFIGVIEVKHSIKGRVRLHIPILKQDKNARIFLLDQLKRVEALKYIEINKITGNIIIKYDQDKINPQLLIGIIAKLLKLDNEILKKKESVVTKELSNMKEVVNLAIYNKTKGMLDGKAIYIILVLILGIKGIRNMPRVLPNGYTMLRWGYNAI
ncbi:HMA2 domain-containing protein [Eubacterium multiforme]|uniref:Uncharacterized protein n=1 Tax=Eubacterium multiforme TaxID=83339 RepID=A0ABT9UXN1_9FIRM|nr:hypothetical protein [Eubacterium multiforme]MDQ0151075.1 hypothetical protein [Eubacterium multiforme]